MRHILTVNVEDYFQVGAFSHLIPMQEWARFDNRLARNVETTLRLLQRNNATATFFASGWIAQEYPQVLLDILDAGHDVGAQTYYQQPVNALPALAFRDDIARSKAAIEAVIQRHVHGFRIGRGWIDPALLWPFEMIADAGYTYDASTCPRGISWRTKPVRTGINEIRFQHSRLTEVPISSTTILGFCIPFAGGNYLRQLPTWFTSRALQQWLDAREHPLVAYFHTWELDRTQPEISAAGFMQRLRHYRHLDEMPDRLASLLASAEFVSIEQFLNLESSDPEIHAEPLAKTVSPSGPAIGTRAAPTEMTLVVPCYNEEESLRYLQRTLSTFTADNEKVLELSFVFVDDGSTDDTYESLARAFRDFPRTKLVRHEVNRGIAAAILTGVDAATTELIAVIDADCTFDPRQILTMLPHLTDDIDVVVASPFHTAGATMHVPPWRQVLSRGASFLYRLVMHNRLSSYTSCFRIYRRNQLANLSINDEGFCGVTEILARLDLAGKRFVEVPAVLQVRLLGQSKIRLLSVIANHLHLWSRILASRILNRPLP